MTPSFYSTSLCPIASFSISGAMWCIVSWERWNTKGNSTCTGSNVNGFHRLPTVFGSSTCSPAPHSIVTSCSSAFTSTTPVSFYWNMIIPVHGRIWTGSDFKLCRRIPNCLYEHNLGMPKKATFSYSNCWWHQPLCHQICESGQATNRLSSQMFI